MTAWVMRGGRHQCRRHWGRLCLNAQLILDTYHTLRQAGGQAQQICWNGFILHTQGAAGLLRALSVGHTDCNLTYSVSLPLSTPV